ncbi:helix-turn-helix transcriptional regulator [Desulfospira joergensenii]|uniref:helix-turn-helix transcriptional regulator n=1 Tax=Desulfospira joergensenii TaxID=53329 RepID=UPI0003B79AD5|nr:helix-turn-helix transcriptional regulator [Desulfospira joergensenii]
MGEMLTTREVAKFLNVNEKMVYSLIAEKGLPASKVTGKWIFPIDLVRQWVEAGTENFPMTAKLPPYHGLVLIAGSNDLLMDKIIATFNLKHENHIAMFGMCGSMGGLQALRHDLCHIATSHLVADNEEYNFPFLKDKQVPAVVNFCQREQGLIIEKGNPNQIRSVKDLENPKIKIVNRFLGTGTRQLFDRELKAAGINGEGLPGYNHTLARHMDVGLEVLRGNASAGPGIRTVASMLGLDFISFGWERFDLLISKDRFFDQGIQYFLSLLKGKVIQEAAQSYGGYDLSFTGKMVYPEPNPEDSGDA